MSLANISFLIEIISLPSLSIVGQSLVTIGTVTGQSIVGCSVTVKSQDRPARVDERPNIREKYFTWRLIDVV